TVSDVNVVDSGTLVVTTPPNIPGAANVLAINSDGTTGVIARGFTYLPQAPTITGLAPATGPPSSVVTITGTGFDSHPQNNEVRFNGALARVTNASSSSLTVLVPYGATSGPVTVNVFGITSTGSAHFDVTAPITSANHATDGYNLIDASVAGGGSLPTF